MEEKNQNNEADSKELPIESSRRKFLKTAGKLAIYTPPAMMVLMQPSQANFNKSANGKYEAHQDKHKIISIISKFLKLLFGRG